MPFKKKVEEVKEEKKVEIDLSVYLDYGDFIKAQKEAEAKK